MQCGRLTGSIGCSSLGWHASGSGPAALAATRGSNIEAAKNMEDRIDLEEEVRRLRRERGAAMYSVLMAVVGLL